MMSIVDFVRDGSRMAFYRDISEIMNKAGLYDNQKEKDKEKHFEKIVDLLEETDFNGNWFDANWVLTSDIKNMCELLEIDGEQFRLYVGSFEYQVWVDTYESESESDSEDEEEEEDSGQGAVEDSDDEGEGDNVGIKCGKCGNYEYQYDILESKEKWERWIKSCGATTCECEKEVEDSDDEEEEGWNCCKCKQDFKENEVEHIDKVDAPVCLNCCVKYGLKNCDDDVV